MTEKEALREAVKRWGPGAVASISPTDYKCAVGSIAAYYGIGLSWDDAFADAERRLKGMQV
jgi:hypothetical protein